MKRTRLSADQGNRSLEEVATEALACFGYEGNRSR
jgi:hypothetical protein